jgi:transcriptional regulator with XRE-family HTH domain
MRFKALRPQAFTGICGLRILPSVSIGGNLKRLREQAGMTQDALGKAAAVKQSDISKWEKKGQVPTINPLLRLASALGVSVNTLLEGVNSDYDRVIERTNSEQLVKKPYEQTYPVTPSGVKERPPDYIEGDRANAPAEDTRASARRVSQPESTRETQINGKIAIILRERADLQGLVDRLHASADDVRAVARILQSGAADESVGAKRSADAGRAAASPGRKRRTGRRRA